MAADHIPKGLFLAYVSTLQRWWFKYEKLSYLCQTYMEYTTNKQKREKWLGREISLTADGWASWFSIMFNVQDCLRDLGEDDISEANRISLPPNIKLSWVKRRECFPKPNQVQDPYRKNNNSWTQNVYSIAPPPLYKIIFLIMCILTKMLLSSSTTLKYYSKGINWGLKCNSRRS